MSRRGMKFKAGLFWPRNLALHSIIRDTETMFQPNRARVAPFEVYGRNTSVPASKSCSPCFRSVNPTMM